MRIALLLLMLSIWPARAEVPESARSKAAVERVTPALQAAVADIGLAWGAPVFIRIFKQQQTLEVWLDDGDVFRLFKSYPICAMSGDLGPKRAEGDNQAPEGFYWVPPRALNPLSAFHLSFDLGFPNAFDRAHGRTGSYLMVHGDCVSVGCFAMGGGESNRAIAEIWTLMAAAFEGGQPFVRVHAFPFPLTHDNLARHAHSPWIGFWQGLQAGYLSFEHHRRPPDISVRAARYTVDPEPDFDFPPHRLYNRPIRDERLER